MQEMKDLQKAVTRAKAQETRTKNAFDKAMGGVYAAGSNSDNQRRKQERAAAAREKYLKARENRERAEKRLDDATKRYRQQGASKSKAGGFQYTDNQGRTITVQRTSTGVVLVNGAPNNSVNYNALKRAAKSRQGFKALTVSESRNISAARSERQAKKPDYELLYNTRGKGKSVYRPKK